MPRAVRFGNGDGRVDRSGAGERARLAGNFSEAQEVSIEREDMPHFTAPRSSREVDPNRVRTGFLIAFAHALNTIDYTPEELAKIFRVARPTVYRTISELNERLDDALDDYGFMTAEDWRKGESPSIVVAEFPRHTVERPSREIDPRRVRIGFLLAFVNLLKSGDYTTEELAKIFRISRPTVYRTINELNERLHHAIAELGDIDDDD